MFFDKPVVDCGQCFWAIPGMAVSASDHVSLTAVMATAADWSFDPETRNAVMSFLNQVYYPQIDDERDGMANQTIIDRLSGTGHFAMLRL